MNDPTECYRYFVADPPEVRLVGTPTTDLEESRDNVAVRCVTDANPPAAVVWRKSGRADIVSVEESLQFRPVTRKDSGTYTCQARNALGSSEPLTVNLDVKCRLLLKYETKQFQGCIRYTWYTCRRDTCLKDV